MADAVPPAARLSVPERVLGILLASTSGAAILAHVFLGVPMVFTVPFFVFPATLVLSGGLLWHRRRFSRFHRAARLLEVGAVGGLLATFVYDAVRPGIRAAFGFTFDPYRAMRIFGELITGRPSPDPLSLAAGWTYHFWNGTSFGMMFALMRPAGGAWYGFAWAMVLQGLMMIAYPPFLQARLDDPGFLMTGIIGHGLWGIVLGLWVRKYGGAP